MAQDGQFSIAVRLLLTDEQRGRLFALCQQEQADVTDVVTKIIGSYLDTRNDLTIEEQASPDTAHHEADALRRQLRQLRMQASRLGADTPAWLRGYITELEQELARTR